jgi:hypothetical protein
MLADLAASTCWSASSFRIRRRPAGFCLANPELHGEWDQARQMLTGE